MPELTNIHALSLLGVGFILGLKHALDTDHVIAVSTIVSEEKKWWCSSIVGGLWGIGHLASLFIVGIILIALQIQIPEKIGLAMEFTVALMLMALGLNVLRKIRKGATFHLHTHSHQEKIHIHPHIHSPESAHTENDSAVHNDHGVRIGKKPLFIGMVHGLAGSAALMLIVLTTISSKLLAILYIGIFGVGSISGMMIMSAVIGLPFVFTSRHQRLHTVVQALAGVVSVCFGILYAWQIGFAEGLFL